MPLHSFIFCLVFSSLTVFGHPHCILYIKKYFLLSDSLNYRNAFIENAVDGVVVCKLTSHICNSFLDSDGWPMHSQPWPGACLALHGRASQYSWERDCCWCIWSQYTQQLGDTGLSAGTSIILFSLFFFESLSSFFLSFSFSLSLFFSHTFSFLSFLFVSHSLSLSPFVHLLLVRSFICLLLVYFSSTLLFSQGNWVVQRKIPARLRRDHDGVNYHVCGYCGHVHQRSGS